MKNILIILMLTIGLFSCGKDDKNANPSPSPTNKSYLKMKVDGVLVELNTGGLGATMLSDIEQMGIGFSNGNTTNLQSVSVVMDDVDINTPKTYIMKDNSLNNFTYVKAQTDIDNNRFFAFGGGKIGNMTIVVTKIKEFSSNAKAINGTFSGTLYNNNGAKIEITEGEFFDSRTN